MKHYSSLSFLAVVIFFSTTILCNTDNKMNLQEITKALVGAHTQAFGKDNILLSGIKLDESNKWNQAIDGCNTFISSRSKKIQPQMKQLTNISHKLLDSIKIVFNGYVSGKDKTKLNIQEISKIISPLASSKPILADIKKSLEKSKSMFDSDKAKDARALVIIITEFLDATIDKVLKDIESISRNNTHSTDNA